MFTPAHSRSLFWKFLARSFVCLVCASLLFVPETGSDPVSVAPLAPIYEHALSQDIIAPHFPASLTEAPGLFRLAGQRSTSVRPGISQAADMWSALCAAPVLPSIRIVPFTWNLGSPVLHLPAARGLIAFALPPPRPTTRPC